MFQFECALLQLNGCVLREEAGRDIFGIRKVCISLLETRAKGKRAEEEAEATDETDSVFLAAWTSARIPPTHGFFRRFRARRPGSCLGSPCPRCTSGNVLRGQNLETTKCRGATAGIGWERGGSETLNGRGRKDEDDSPGRAEREQASSNVRNVKCHGEKLNCDCALGNVFRVVMDESEEGSQQPIEGREHFYPIEDHLSPIAAIIALRREVTLILALVFYYVFSNFM